MAFTQLKLKSSGRRIRVDLSKVAYFAELEAGTELGFENGSNFVVAESYQTVSNRAAKADTAAVEEPAVDEAA